MEINQFITALLEVLRSMPEALERQIEFYPATVAAKVVVDPDKFKQVLINIIRNACEAVNEGDIVNLQVDSSVNLDRACINIHNGGEPIPPEVLPKLTQPFYSTKSTGTGLGLAIVKRIVEAHGGDLLIQSSASEGTTVSVRLPLATLN